MKPILKSGFLWMIIIAIQPVIKAQINVQKIQVGINVGAFVYQGDLTPSAIGSYRTASPAIDLFATKLFSSSLALRGNLAFGALRGNDAAYAHPEYRRERALNFRSPVVELSVMAEWNPLGKNYSSRGFAPYFFAGGGISFLKIRRDHSRFNVLYFGEGSEIIAGLNADARHNTPKVLLVLPVGAGIRYYLSDRIGVGAETTYRIMSNDYLDGFSQAANPARGDHYHSHTVGVLYRFGKKNLMDCPVVMY